MKLKINDLDIFINSKIHIYNSRSFILINIYIFKFILLIH